MTEYEFEKRYASAKTIGGSNIDTDSLAQFFDPEGPIYDGTNIPPLCSDVGYHGFKALVNFISTKVFPPTGEWISANPVARGKGREQSMQYARVVEQLMLERIGRSNFYEKLKRLLLNHLVYGRSFGEAFWSSKLYFNSADIELIKATDTLDGEPPAFFVPIKMFKESFNKMFTEQTEMDTETVIKGLIYSGDKYTEHFYLEDEKKLLIPKKRNQYSSCPLAYIDLKDSLGKQCLVPAIKADYYAMSAIKRNSYDNQPNMTIPEYLMHTGQTLPEGGGLVPLNQDGRIAPIELLKTDERTLAGREQQAEELLRERLFLREINALRTVDPTNPAYAGAMVNILEAIYPHIEPLVTKSIPAMLSRAWILLKENDAAIKDALKKAKIDAQALDFVFDDSGYIALIDKYKTAANITRYAQLAGPFLNFDPASRARLDGDMAIKMIAAAHNVPELNNSDKQVAQSLQQAAQQQQQVEGMQAENLQSQTDLNNRKEPQE